MKNILDYSWQYIQEGNKRWVGIAYWKKNYEQREIEYLKEPLENFLQYYPKSISNFEDILSSCRIETISSFKNRENFPFQEIYTSKKRIDTEDCKRGRLILDVVLSFQDVHEFNIEDLEDYILENYLPNKNISFNNIIYDLYHKVNGVNKEKIEDFLFNYNVNYDTKPDRYFDNCYTKREVSEQKEKYKNEYQEHKNLALRDLLSLKPRIKYSHAEIEDEYIKRGIIDSTFISFIKYTGKEKINVKKWEDFLIKKGSSKQILALVESMRFNCYNLDKKVNFERLLTAAINKKDEFTSQVIYLIMMDYKNANLQYLEQALLETKDEKYIKAFYDNKELQYRYFEQIVKEDEIKEQGNTKKLLLK